MELVFGIDMGTSYFKLGLFDRSGHMRGMGRVRVEKDVDAQGRCEVPIERFWSLLREGLSQACRQARVSTKDIRGLSYSSQANTFVLMDKDHLPLTPLVLWTDQRVKQIDPVVCRLWKRADFLSTTGLGLGPSAQGCVAKLKWFQQNMSDTWLRTRGVMTISDYLTFALTGRCVGDMGTAGLTGLLDMPRSRWWQSALDEVSLDTSYLSSVLRPGSLAGNVNDGEQNLGLPPGIPLSAGSLDHHIAAIGAGVGTLADMSESTGTVLACLNYVDAFLPRGQCCMGPQPGGKGYYQLAFSEFGATALDWYHLAHAPNIDLDDLADMAETAPPGCDGLIAVANHDSPEERCSFRNVTSKHQTGYFVRAIMEAISAELAVLLTQLCPDQSPQRIVATGGGARSHTWLQMKADMLNVEVVVSNCTEPACKGAAMLAAVGANWFKDLDECARLWIGPERVFSPVASRHGQYESWRQRNHLCRRDVDE